MLARERKVHEVLVGLAVTQSSRDGQWAFHVARDREFVFVHVGVAGKDRPLPLGAHVVPQVVPHNFVALRVHAFGFQHPADILESGYHHLPVVFAIQAFFTGAGGWILVFYGALEGLSSEILEAAAIDGCSAIQQALFIKLPLMSKYVYYMVILSFAGGMQLFVEPQLFNAASAVYASNVWSLNQVALRYAFTFAKFGVAASIAVILLILGIIAAFIILRWTDFYSTDFS